VDPQAQDVPSISLQQKLNELLSRSNWQRTVDIGVDKIERGIVPKATSLKMDRPSVFQLMTAGVDVTHLVYLTQSSPDDLMISEGRARPNALGRGFCLQVGTWYVYVPLVAGDPATFTARVSDASSDLPAQQSATDTGGAAPGTQVVSTLNRNGFATAQKNVTTAGTAVNLAALAVPGGFALTIQAKSANTGNIWIGNSQANAQDHTVAFLLPPGTGVKLYVSNANLVWIDSAVNGEGVQLGVEV
jgi:hypothetical protein